MVSTNTIVFHVQLILPTEENLAQLLCAGGYAQPHQPVPQLSVPAGDDVRIDNVVGEVLAAGANASSFGVLTPGSPLIVASDTAPRLSAKRLV